MIEELNIDLLKKYGFDSESIEKLTTRDNYETPSFKGGKCFFASNIENRIYSGIDASRRYFIENKNIAAFPYTEPDLIPEYFKKSLSVYIEAQRKIAGAIFIEIDTINEFRANEIVITQKKIKEYEVQPAVFSSFAQKINLYKHYLKWLNSLNDSEMITDKIQALFKFIDFLHSNIANFKKCDIVISQLILLKREISNFRSFADKNKFDELQLTSNNKLKEIDDNIIHLMKSKVIELKIYDLGDTSTFRKWNSQAIGDLKKNYSKEDAPIIIQHQKKYFEFKTEINFAYFEAYLPQDFKELMNLLFDESKGNKVNEVETKMDITDVGSCNEYTGKSIEDTTIVKTLHTNLNLDQLKNLHKELNTKYIKKISEGDFIYWLSGKPIIDKMAKIYWKVGKGKAIQLFKAICVNCEMPLLNKCVQHKAKNPFDSNDYKKESNEIGLIAGTFRPKKAIP